ncbi:MAG: hypothetical protein RR837_10970 [Bacteroidales bacterium]
MIQVTINPDGSRITEEIPDQEIEIFPESDNQLNYKNLVEQLIRAKYSISEEFAILRQKEDKPTEYTEYYNYCEQCKQEAKLALELV